MYSLKCSYYTKEFKTISELIDDVIESGMDPNYEITKKGVGMGEELIDYIQFQSQLVMYIHSNKNKSYE